MTENPTPNAALDQDAFDLDEWLSTGTLARRAVPIYNDPALVAKHDILVQKLADAQATASDEEASIGQGSAIADLHEQMVALHQRWEDSKATWTVRALTEDEVREAAEQHPDPQIPAILGLPKPAGGTWSEEQLAAGRDHQEAREKAQTARSLAMIARAVVEVRTTRGATTHVTVEQIHRLRARPHGKTQTQRLLDAVLSATSGEVEVPRPTLPGRSDSDRG